MAALLSGVGQVASIAQLAGVDAYGLISMIVDAAQTVKRNRETCQLLARRTRMIGDLLQQLERTQLMQHTETRNPVEQLEETLRHTYLLIESCREGSYLHSCFLGGKQADQLREVQDEITFYLQLFPLVSFVDTTRTWERVLNRDRPSSSQGTTNELCTVRHSEPEDRITTEALETAELEDPETLAPSKSELEDTASQLNLISGLVAKFPCFSFSEILAATNKFSCRNFIGQGGFGDVYKGQLCNGLDVAVKRHKTSSLQGQREFIAEIKAMENLRHGNVIVPHGICVEGEEKILVYEYMPKKCLATIIADKTKWNLVNWTKRLQIIQGIANGLAYLHGHPQMCIVHRDIKSSNILLDHEMNAKISDLGLAVRLNPNVPIEVDLTVSGTRGYAAPEYIATGKISTKQDVYGFGIVLLEIMGGKLCHSYIRRKNGITSLGLSLPENAHKYKKKPQKFLDPVLRAHKHEMAQIMKCIQVAMLCVHDLARHRPTMSEVVTMLGSIKNFNELQVQQQPDPVDIRAWWEEAVNKVPNSNRRRLNGVVIYTFWNIWKERNRRIFNNAAENVLQVAARIKT